MTTPAKRKGDAGELEVAKRLADLTGWPVKRKLGAGRAEDTGDLYGLPQCTGQVKAYADVLRAIREGLPELRVQQAHAQDPFAALFVRRPRMPEEFRWMAVMDLDQFATLLREATGPDVPGSAPQKPSERSDYWLASQSPEGRQKLAEIVNKETA